MPTKRSKKNTINLIDITKTIRDTVVWIAPQFILVLMTGLNKLQNNLEVAGYVGIATSISFIIILAKRFLTDYTKQ